MRAPLAQPGFRTAWRRAETVDRTTFEGLTPGGTVSEKRINERATFTTEGSGQFGEESKSLDSFPVSATGPASSISTVSMHVSPADDPADFDD